VNDFDSLRGVPGISDTMLSTVDAVRRYMRDHPQLNRLINGEESSDRMILYALMDAISTFNGRPPPNKYTLEQMIQEDCLPILIRLTVITLLEGIGLLQTRNHVNYSAGGTNVGINDKTPMIMGWLRYFKETTDAELLRKKTSLNIMSILGPGNAGVSSEYWTVHNTFSYW